MATNRATAPQTTAKDSWALGIAVFAGILMMAIGMFQIIAGFAALLNDEFYRITPHYVFKLDTTTWGWVHLLMGFVMAFAGYAIFAGKTWARGVGIAVAGLSATANFLVIPRFPVWALLVIALDVAVIWALAVYMDPYRDT
jgi:hypothetical protein